MSIGKYKIVLPIDFGDTEEVLRTINITNKAVSLKNIYQNSFVLDNKLFGGIINPNTLKPADNLQSIYVIADNALEAKMYSLELFNMSYEDGMEYIKDTDIAVIWCFLEDSDLVCKSTDNFENY